MDMSPHVLVLCVFTAHTGFSVLLMFLVKAGFQQK